MNNNMKALALFLILCWIFTSCEDNESETPVIKPGIYKGQFTRTSPYSKYPPSNVSIEFTSDRFSGESDMTNFPAICSGTYSIEGKEIIFKNECFFSANFDWTLILQGNYQFQIRSNSLEITRTQNEVTDTYSITLQ